MTRLPLLLFVLVPLVIESADKPLSRIAFGSCVKQSNPQPIWKTVVESNPDLFLFIGDNIYGDAMEAEILQTKWQQLGKNQGFQNLKRTCPILATWDDHDYGWNDAGREYPLKRESQKLFLDFFDEPADSPRRKRAGIYDAKIIGPEGMSVQIILLDTRYHRSKLRKGRNLVERGEGITGTYLPDSDPAKTMLGEAQWKWFEQQLKQPAQLRIIASSIQLISNQHRWEKWGNLPRERERFFELLHKTKANGVIVISGDRHTAEISKLDIGLGYPLYDITSSSLNQSHVWRSELNPDRIGGMYYDENFGMISIDWSESDPTVRLQIRDMKGRIAIQTHHALSELNR